MDKLGFRIQRQNNLNDVYVSNNPDDMYNGVHHVYHISADLGDGVKVTTPIHFQKGPRKDPDSIHGVLENDLLEILIDRMRGHQASGFATREGAIMLTKLEEAAMWSAKRADDRFERGVLGTNNK